MIFMNSSSAVLLQAYQFNIRKITLSMTQAALNADRNRLLSTAQITAAMVPTTIARSRKDFIAALSIMFPPHELLPAVLAVIVA